MQLALLAGVAMTAASCAGGASAQDAGGSTTLEQIDVQGRGQGTALGAGRGEGAAPVQGFAPVATTTGSKTDTALKLIPQSIGVVGRQQMDALGAQKTDEAVRYSAGVFAQPFGEDSDTNWFYIRGFDATQTGVYRDGMQLYSYAFGNFYQDSYLLERVEVLRGASSALYGGGNVGGIINYVSKRPLDADFGQIEVGVDNYPTAFAAFDVNKVIPNDLVTKGDPLPPVWKYRVTGKVEGGNGYSDKEDGWRGVVQGSATYSPNDGTSLNVYANYQHVDQKHGGGDFLPYYGTVRRGVTAGGLDLGRIDRKEQYSEPSEDRYDRRQAMVGYELNHDVDDVWTVNSKARFAYADLKEELFYPFGYQGPPAPGSIFDTGFNLTPDARNLLSRVRFDHHTQSYSFTTDNSVTGSFSTGGIDHTVLFGIDYKFYGIDEIQASSFTNNFAAPGAPNIPPISVDNPNYGGNFSATVPYIDEWVKLHQVGVYAQEQARFGGGFIATLNGRYDRYWLDGDVENTGFDRGPDYSRDGGRFSGRAGLGYEFDNGVVPYVSVASTFNPIVGANLLNLDTNGDGFADGTFGRTAFKPETGVQYEAGVKWAPTWFPGLFSAAIFELTKKNVVTGTTSATTVQSQVGEVRSRGVEFEAQANLTENWRFIGSFTAYDLEIRDDENRALIGDTPFLVPEVIGSAFLDYTFTTGALKGFSLGGGVRYLGKSEATQPNTVTVPSATVFDAAARYQWENYKISLNVTNLLDKRYVSACQGLYTCSYAEGRRALVKASYTW